MDVCGNAINSLDDKKHLDVIQEIIEMLKWKNVTLTSQYDQLENYILENVRCVPKTKFNGDVSHCRSGIHTNDDGTREIIYTPELERSFAGPIPWNENKYHNNQITKLFMNVRNLIRKIKCCSKLLGPLLCSLYSRLRSLNNQMLYQEFAFTGGGDYVYITLPKSESHPFHGYQCRKIINLFAHCIECSSKQKAVRIVFEWLKMQQIQLIKLTHECCMLYKL